MYHVLRKAGYQWNHKRLHRVYVSLGLNIRRKRKRRLPTRVKEPLVLPIGPNLNWSMDFMHDSLIYGKSFRTFNVIDDFNREALNITIDTSISSKRVIRQLDQLIEWRGKPKMLRVDNGPEFIAYNMAEWCEKHDIRLQFIEPGKPTQNSFVERFNRTFRDEILNVYLFESLTQARALTKEWIWKYNNIRPHESLFNLTPVEFNEKYGKVTDFPTFQIDQYSQLFVESSLITTVAN